MVHESSRAFRLRKAKGSDRVDTIISLAMAVLLGDVTGNRAVSNTDVGAVKAQVDPTTPVTDVRVGAQSGYDRFVLQFSSAIPAYTVTRQTSSTFMRSPRGDQVTLAGTAGVLVAVKPIDWTSYNGTTQLAPGYTYLKEARQVENFEGVQQWGLGIQGTPCLRVFTLTSPMRLVVDVQAS